MAFQNRPPTGARVPSRTGASFARRKRPDSCFLDLVILPSGPERSHLPLGDSFPLEGRRPGQAKAGFCTPEHPLGGPVKPQKGPARKQDQGSIGPPRRCPSRGTGGAEVGSRPGWLSSAIPHWACVPVCERAIRPRRPWLATGGSFPLGNARHFEAKPGACTQGSRFAVPFKQQKAPAPKQGQGGFGPLRACIALGPREVWAGPRRE